MKKNDEVSLSNNNAELENIVIGLGCLNCDLNLSLFMLANNGKVRNDKDFIYYHNLTSECGSVDHSGDNRTGSSDNDAEQLVIKLSTVSNDIKRLVVIASIYDESNSGITFGKVSNAYMRLYDLDSDFELIRFDLTDDYCTETAVIFGEIHKQRGKWKFKAIGQGYDGGLETLCSKFGIDVD